MIRVWRRPARRAVALVVLAASAAVLAAAYGFQYLGGLEPCPLCVYQRYPYFATIALGLAALFFADKPLGGVVADALMVLAGLVFLAGAGIAAFHVGVEQHWWAGTSVCGAPAGGPAETLEELERRLMATPAARCDEVAWSLFGVSMAGYNALVSLALAAFALTAPWAAEARPRRRQTGGRREA